MNRIYFLVLRVSVGVAVTLISLIAGVSSAISQNNVAEIWKSCQSSDADTRLVGCTAIIKATGFGSQSRLADALDGRCWAFHVKGQPELAIDDCKASIKLRPKYSYVYNNLGAAYLGIGDYRSALDALNKAIELKPDFFWSRLNRAKALIGLGDKSSAMRDYEYILNRDPANHDIQRALNDLRNENLVVATAQPPNSTFNSSTTSPSLSPPQRRRVALVIGNSNYHNSSPLINPGNDVQTLASALRIAGFQSVTVKTDLSREQIIAALRDFAAIADTADWAAVYYSGHGIEFNGVNYLVPIDARLKVDRDVDLETVDVGKILSAIDGAKRLRLVILDACRDNPFLGQMRRTGATRSIGRGLARIEPEAGTLIVYSAKHGELALDGDGPTSPFVDALVKRIGTPNLEIRRLFDLVRDDVITSTKKKQQPFSYGSLSGSEDFFFVGSR